MPDQRNLLLAVLISVLILSGFHYFYEVPRQARLKQIQAQEQLAQEQSGQVTAKADTPAAQISAAADMGPVLDRDEALNGANRIKIDSPRLYGSLSGSGIRFDDLTLTDYFTGLDRQAHVDLLSPSGTESPYYASFGWVAENPSIPVPDDKTIWTHSGASLSADHPVTLIWNNGQGLIFERIIAVDANYMFTITDKIHNQGTTPVTLYPYASVTRQGTPTPGGTGIEGGVAIVDDHLKTVTYKDFEKGAQTVSSKGGWIGFSDKYWLVAVIPDQDEAVAIDFRHSKTGKLDLYQDDYKSGAKLIAPNNTVETTSRMFAGAKEVTLLTTYRDSLGIPKLDLAVDWGWFRFLTKPFFYGIHYFGNLIGNFGLGILAFTVVMRIIIFPLAYKTFREMSRMKDLAPEMAEIREANEGNKPQMQIAIMELYKKEKVNPLSGCVPLLLQIPIFIALYKVLSVTIEMRYAPFFGWVHDLSAPDPTNVFNLFGLLPYDPAPYLPHFLLLGAWPLIYGTTLMLLQKINPAPPDPVQAKMMMLSPVLATFFMAKLPAGVMIYYSWSNLISIGQQWAIRRHYHKTYRVS